MLSDSKSNLEAALAYAALGWLVFPCQCIRVGACSCGATCKSPGKHPMTRNGLKDATTDLGQIRAWWEKEPDANIGIRTGPESNLWVLDLDGEAGIEALAKWEAENGSLPATPTVRTGGGGRHLYFAYPEGGEIKNRTRVAGLKIDVRGDGGYVIAPPSNHTDGDYRWENEP
jgi:putative DNA primase/helicase